MARSNRGEVILKALQVDRGVRGDLRAVAIWKKAVALGIEDGWKGHRRDRVAKRHGSARQRRHQRLKYEGKCPGDKVVLPQIGQDGHDRATRVESCVLRCSEI